MTNDVYFVVVVSARCRWTDTHIVPLANVLGREGGTDYGMCIVHPVFNFVSGKAFIFPLSTMFFPENPHPFAITASHSHPHSKWTASLFDIALRRPRGLGGMRPLRNYHYCPSLDNGHLGG